MHSKFMVVDKGRRTLVSSVNWSHTSFMRNREAGVILEDCDCTDMLNLYQSVFEHDWDNGLEYQLTNEYSRDDQAFITDTTQMSVILPPPANIDGAYVTTLKKYNDVTVVSGYTSPDNARDTVMGYLDKVQSSLQVRN